MQTRRLAFGGSVNRSRTLAFEFNGRRYTGHPGDTLASALLANDVHLVARSFKYHRPRGIVGRGAEEPNAIVQAGTGAVTEPNLRATQLELYAGLSARSVNCWPSVRFDALAATGLFSRLLPAGFYYKTFMWPASGWHRYERLIRAAAGLGHAPRAPDPDCYDELNAHCDVLVAGAGPAGIATALAAARTGARVIVADEGAQAGGQLLFRRETIDGQPAAHWLARSLAELRAMPEVTLLERATVFGYYDHDFLGIAERLTDHLPPDARRGARQRRWRVRARRVVLATGAIERPLVFCNNDRPGVMLASAVSEYLNRYAVAPGTRAVIYANNDDAYHTVHDLVRAGVAVSAIVDCRPRISDEAMELARSAGVDPTLGAAVADVAGRRRVRAAAIGRLDAGGRRLASATHRVPCDLIAVSGGWNPAVHLHCHAGGKTRWDEARACFVPGETVQHATSAGGARGSFSLAECLAEGFAAGAAAARHCGFATDSGAPPRALPARPWAITPLWRTPASELQGEGARKQFVDLQNDTTAADIEVAAREGYEAVEHLKRYTLLGFGTDQGKLGNINGMAILAETLGRDIPATGTTTFRPFYTPTSFGAVAGISVGERFDAVRKSAIHAWHVEQGARFENVGQWKRPWYYPRAGETMQAAVDRECLAARGGVAVLDASTLGKIEVRGRDAAEFLDRIYTNGWKKLAPGRCRYGLMLGEDGMIMDDGVCARLAEDHYYLTTTTGGAAHVMAWLERWLQTEWPELAVYLTSVTDHWATVSLAGPRSRDVVAAICTGIALDADSFPFMSFRDGTVAGVPARVFRVSFSGELGFEINVDANAGRHVWQAVVEAGRPYDITPYGTEAMHVLRAEKGYIIVGQDTDGSMTPDDMGLGRMVARHKDFIGKRSLARPHMLESDRKQFVGLLSEDPATVIPEGAQIVDAPRGAPPEAMTGHVTSSYFSASLGRSIALALVRGGRARIGESVYLPLADGRRLHARIADPVFFDPRGDRQNA